MCTTVGGGIMSRVFIIISSVNGAAHRRSVDHPPNDTTAANDDQGLVGQAEVQLDGINVPTDLDLPFVSI
jgi:hypothetical protein